MDFTSSVKRKRVRKADGSYIVVEKESPKSEADHNLSLYTTPFAETTISLLEFHELGSARLRLLRALEVKKDNCGGDWAKFRSAATEIVKNHGEIIPGLHSADQTEIRRRDRISHFILRLTFCQTQDEREWFTKHETDLFRIRFGMEGAPSKMRFLELNNIRGLEELGADTKERAREAINDTLNITSDNLATTSFFKVGFEHVYELLLTHKVYLEEGTAIISVHDLEAMIVPQFRESIASSLAHASRHIGSLHEEGRLVPLMRQLASKETAYDKRMMDANADTITVDMLDELSISSFPLCMRAIHSRLRAEHKLRHFARQQYGLFLKGIGLSMQQAIEFNRREFTKVMDSEQFAKGYVYNIRHMYGQEGKRVEGRPLSCPQIILGSAPAKNDCHGCPFRHSELPALSKTLNSLGFNNNQVQQMVDLSKAHRYDKACTRYFEYAHGMEEGRLECVITHPNEYYSLSRRTLKGHIPQSASANSVMEVDIEDAIPQPAPPSPEE